MSSRTVPSMAKIAYLANSKPVSDSVRRAAIANNPVIGIIRSLFDRLNAAQVRYCHWKSNIRLPDTLAGNEDIDVLVDRRDYLIFQEVLVALGFKFSLSRSGIDHPGVFHAFCLDQESSTLVHLHGYYQIVSGDSLVKNYRFPIAAALLDSTRDLHGVRVPSSEAELVLFALRMALKHVSPVEIAMVNRGYDKIAREMVWLRTAANEEKASALCNSWFPTIDVDLFGEMLDAISDGKSLMKRISTGLRVAIRLRGLRRMGLLAESIERLHRVFHLVSARADKRKDLTLQSGGLLLGLVGPKASGKSTLGRELESRLGRYLDVQRIHAGKPPATALTMIFHLLVPFARRLFQNERPREYEKAERRREKRYSLVYVLHMTMLAHERYYLLRQAYRDVTAGSIVISDRFPSDTTGAIDSSCFDEEGITLCRSPLKRWLMQRERALYRRMPKPDLVIRLAAPLEMTIERDATRVKADKPDAAAVQRRRELETTTSFAGVSEIVIDSSRPLDTTIHDVVSAVWRVL